MHNGLSDSPWVICLAEEQASFEGLAAVKEFSHVISYRKVHKVPLLLNAFIVLAFSHGGRETAFGPAVGGDTDRA
jgi:hypothetical protein